MKSARTLALAVLLSLAAANASHLSTLNHRDAHRLVSRQGLLGFGDLKDDTSSSPSSSSSSSSSSSGLDSQSSLSQEAASATSAAAASLSSAASAASASASRAAAAASSSAAATTSSSAAAAATSSIAAAASESRSAASASATQAAASASASTASASSASSASAAATSSAPTSSTVYLTQTVVAPTQATSTTDASAALPSADASSGSSGGVSTGLIIGISVAGGVAILTALIFLYMRFGGKRFDGLDDNDVDIKWPELKQDPDSAAMQPLPARRTGGAGFDMGDNSDNGHDGGYGSSLKGRDSFTGSTTALAAAAPGYPVNDPHYAGSAVGTDNGYPQPPTMQPGQFYDMYPQNGGGAAADAQSYYNDAAMQQQYSDAHHAPAGYPNNAGYPDVTKPYGQDPYAQAHAHVNMQQQNSFRM